MQDKPGFIRNAGMLIPALPFVWAGTGKTMQAGHSYIH